MNNPSTHRICPHAEECSGCQSWQIPYSKQIENKLQDLKTKIEVFAQTDSKIDIPIRFLSAGSSHLRTRLDLTLKDGKMGFYAKQNPSEDLTNPPLSQRRPLVDILECWQWEEPLQRTYDQIRQILFPIQQGSLRLRIAPDGKVGLWLDLANKDIQFLLQEQTTLKKLQSFCEIIELGQRRKSLKLPAEDFHGNFKLGPPRLYPWFQTWLSNHQPHLLSCTVGSFTQPGLKSNELLIREFRSWLLMLGEDLKKSSLNFEDLGIFEYGAGIGNFTLPALDLGFQVFAYENDPLACQALEYNSLNFRKKLHLNPQPFEIKPLPRSAAIVNPPRSGLLKFLPFLRDQVRPQYLYYVSCFPESFAQDFLRLIEGGYECQELAILDQFPQTNHYEVLARFKRRKLS